MTLHYAFPTITHIDQVLPHIDDTFKVVDKEGYTYINYLMMMPSVFPPVDDLTYEMAAIRRECRGIAFDSDTGEIVSRPFHKFFNLGEPASGVINDPLKHPHDVLEKLDGSMLRPLPNGRWGTKMGVTEVALSAETFVASRPQYDRFAESMMSCGRTPIFEYVGPHNRIVLEYEEDMTLLAIRNTTTGHYLSYDDMAYAASTFGIPVVSKDGRTIDEVKEDETSEGIVIRYTNGHMLKVKSDWYVKVHRAKELLTSDRRFVEAILNQSLDDAIASFLPDDQKRAEEKLSKFDGCMYTVHEYLEESWLRACEYETKKDFAIDTKDTFSALSRSYCFNRWDEKVTNAEEFLINRLKSAIGSNKKFEETMKELGFDLSN